MQNSLAVEKAFYELYFIENGTYPDQNTMDKLMYLAQMESLINKAKLLFNEDFYVGVYGPYLCSVVDEYEKDAPYSSVSEGISDPASDLVSDVLDMYFRMSKQELHARLYGFAFKNAAKNGAHTLSFADMIIDASYERIKRAA